MYEIDTRYEGGMAFVSSIDNHAVRYDAGTQVGGNESAPSPKKVFLSSLAACTGMDVVALLQKMRVEYSDLSILTKADLTEEHPKVFTHIEVVYKVRIDESKRSKFEKVVQMSQETYCGISEMLRKNSPVNYRIEYL